jgi:hypothetical protein
VRKAAARLVYLVNDEDQLGGTDPVDVSGGPNSASITQAVERPQIERPQAPLQYHLGQVHIHKFFMRLPLLCCNVYTP